MIAEATKSRPRGANSQASRTLCDEAGDAGQKFLADFVVAWTKVMNADRLDLFSKASARDLPQNFHPALIRAGAEEARLATGEDRLRTGMSRVKTD